MVQYGIVLGHKICTDGIQVDEAKVDLIQNLPAPKTVRDIHSFVGHAGFYRRFIKDFSKIARPLCNLLGKDVPFIFDEDYQKAYDALKERLTTAPIL